MNTVYMCVYCMCMRVPMSVCTHVRTYVCACTVHMASVNVCDCKYTKHVIIILHFSTSLSNANLH